MPKVKLEPACRVLTGTFKAGGSRHLTRSALIIRPLVVDQKCFFAMTGGNKFF